MADRLSRATVDFASAGAGRPFSESISLVDSWAARSHPSHVQSQAGNHLDLLFVSRFGGRPSASKGAGTKPAVSDT